MTQFSLVETAGRHAGRLIVAGIVLCIATPALTLIPIIAVLEPPAGRPPASAWWLLVGGITGAAGAALAVWVGARLLRVVLAVRLTSEDDLVLEGLFAATSITIGDIAALAEGNGSAPHPTLVIQHRYRTVSVPGDVKTLEQIANTIGERNPYVALGPWTRLFESEAEPQGAEQQERDPAHFLFLSGRRRGWTFQAIAATVTALAAGVTIVAFWDKLSDALGGGARSPLGQGIGTGVGHTRDAGRHWRAVRASGAGSCGPRERNRPILATVGHALDLNRRDHGDLRTRTLQEARACHQAPRRRASATGQTGRARGSRHRTPGPQPRGRAWSVEAPVR